MFGAAENATIWTWITLGLFLALTPAVLFTLGKANLAQEFGEKLVSDELLSLARELDEATDRMIFESGRSIGLVSKEKRALKAILRLSECAEHFHTTLKNAKATPKAMRQSYLKLIAAYESAQRELPVLNAYQTKRELFARVDNAMKELNIIRVPALQDQSAPKEF